jgi:hypothetical protein
MKKGRAYMLKIFDKVTEIKEERKRNKWKEEHKDDDRKIVKLFHQWLIEPEVLEILGENPYISKDEIKGVLEGDGKGNIAKMIDMQEFHYLSDEQKRFIGNRMSEYTEILDQATEMRGDVVKANHFTKETHCHTMEFMYECMEKIKQHPTHTFTKSKEQWDSFTGEELQRQFVSSMIVYHSTLKTCTHRFFIASMMCWKAIFISEEDRKKVGFSSCMIQGHDGCK